MAQRKKINYDKYAAGLFSRTEQYADKVRRHFADAVNELLKLTATGDLGASGAFSFSDSSKLSNEANEVLRDLYASVYQEIKGGVEAEWEYANLSCDALIESIFGKGLKEDNHFARWFSRNQDAMDSFFKRKSAYGGLNLSQKVWRYVGNLKTEMEVALSVSLGQGDSASTVSRKVRQYLQEPDKMFRRFRVKTGEKDILDADGNVVGKEPIYGRRWKRKVIDPQTGAVTWENFNPRNYHPGQGVYRSSYKNAMRLTRTETNMAYRAADQDRWQRMDFVIGYRVCLSNNHPAPDICNDLSAPRDDRKSDRGVYPKDFVFKGWHPQCRCYVIPILASDDEFIAMEQAKLQGKEPPTPKGIIRKPNKAFYDWIEQNKERMETATIMPYWAQDNQDYITGKKGQKKVKTDAEREAIRKAWAERAKKNQQALAKAGYVAKYAADYPEIDLTDLQAYITAKNVTKAQAEAKAVAKQIAAVHKDEAALGKLIPDVHTWKQTFTSEELHGVYDAVEKKLASLSSLTLEQQQKKLHFEAVDFLGGNMHNVQGKYKTWKVSQAAYLKKEAEVVDAIEWQNIDKILQEAKTFKTKSQPYLDLIRQLEAAISSKNKADAQNIVADMQAKRQALAKAAAARAKKRIVAKAGDTLYVGGDPFTASELAKLQDYETKILDSIMKTGDIDYYLNEQYHDYVLSLAHKYYPKQVSQFAASQLANMNTAAQSYLSRTPINPNYIWGCEVGGPYDAGSWKIAAYITKLKGLTKEELSIVKRFTNGSTFSNAYNLRHSSPYWKSIWDRKMRGLTTAQQNEQIQIIEEWSQGANFVLDQMERYNGITFRGLNSGGGPELRKSLTAAFKSGKPWINEAPCSTSMKINVAKSFDGDTILVIHNKTGVYIHPISDYSGEYEIMTLRGAKYKVLSPPKRINGRYFVELEEIV